MALDTAAKRSAASGAGRPWLRGHTPDATLGSSWRASAGLTIETDAGFSAGPEIVAMYTYQHFTGDIAIYQDAQGNVTSGLGYGTLSRGSAGSTDIVAAYTYQAFGGDIVLYQLGDGSLDAGVGYDVPSRSDASSNDLIGLHSYQTPGGDIIIYQHGDGTLTAGEGAS